LLYEVSNLKKVDFGATGVNEILQNVSYIMATVMNSSVMDREFGWNPNLDAPINLAVASNAANLIEAIHENEPRAIVEQVREEGNAIDGNIKFIVTVRIDESI